MAPRADGLPSLRVLLVVPALLLIAGTILVALTINGSSSGAFYGSLHDGADPDLIAGQPEMIRTDEWNVQTVWAISQAQQGLPVVNETFPGGMDATLPQDLPRADWSVAFRPHLLGFLFLDVDHALTLKWWLPALALIAAVYCFVVTVLPRRPILAAGLAVGFYFSPFFQWWFLQTTFWPVVWGLATMTAVWWALRSRSWGGPVAWAAVVAYLTVVMAMGIYVPFIVPVAIVVVFFAIGMVISVLRERMPVRFILARATLVIGAGLVGSAIVGIWLYSKQQTVAAFLNTAYPGERLQSTGASDLGALASAVGSSFTRALKTGGFLGLNSSEASTFFFVGAFLIPVVGWLIVRAARARRRLPWELIALTAAIVVFLAFLFVPGWDAIAHLLLLDRTTPNRVRIGVGLASIVMVVFIVKELSTEFRPGRVFSAGTAALFLLSQLGIAAAVYAASPPALALAGAWWLLALGGAVAIYLIARARPAAGVAVFVAMSLFGSVTVNPIYRGVLDLRETPTAQAIMKLDADSDTTWVGIGGRLTTAMLLESGVEAYNGFQGAPSREMWDSVDPSGQFEFQWNRLAGVGWTPGIGEPVVSNPAPDQILSTFDACSNFAQENVDFVLSDDSVHLDSPCLEEESDRPIAGGDSLTIWQVVPAR
ncbi:hypothetical protein WJX64_08340 [Leifsonia sp. YIM 134122]|uniref:Glycosyltransferase RgtA/B/C/D-like domain-containing protein n=1 Tax=Leifsonia stereocauli TaxID=3134136 RepID=A0ABU9W3J3_9MICO